MKCRAKMIDGSPVTFERIDLGAMHELDGGRDGYTSDKVFAERWTYHRAVHVTDFEGEGFNVRSVWPDYKAARAHSQRLDADRACLENAGVDTATVEYHQWGVNRFGKPWEKWLPLFTPVVKQPKDEGLWPIGWGPRTIANTAPPYPNEPIKSWSDAMARHPLFVPEPTPDMLQAGCEEACLTIRNYSPCSIAFLSNVWRAMEKARTK